MRKRSNFLTALISTLSISALVFPLFASAYQAAPFSVTTAPLFITEKSVRLTGQVNSNEMPDTYQWFEWGVVGKSDVYTTPHRSFGSGSTLRNTSENLSGLAPNMQYFYRQVAENGRGKSVGMNVYFTTKPLPVSTTPILVVETRTPTAITENSVTLKGYVSPHGNSQSRYWFEWGATMELSNRTSSRTTGTNSTNVEQRLTNLLPGTPYFYRIVGENDLGIVYGTTRMVVTHGVPPEVVTSEAPREQYVPPSSSSGDGVDRTVTTSGKDDGRTSGAGDSGYNAFRPASSIPNPISFGFFSKKPSSGTTTEVSGSTQTSNPFSRFFGSLSGKDVAVVVEKVGPEKVPAHTPVEYRISYLYQKSIPATSAQLKIVLPEHVVYIGDNTVNELLLEESPGPERTYVLPLGRLENGASRTVSILGMTTASAQGTFPEARARLEYADPSGVVVVVAGEEGVLDEDAETTQGDTSFSILPHSLLGWVLYLLVVVGTIIGVRKVKEYYARRKEEIAKEEELHKAQVSAQEAEKKGSLA
jgi:hypothetical protein